MTGKPAAVLSGAFEGNIVATEIAGMVPFSVISCQP